MEQKQTFTKLSYKEVLNSINENMPQGKRAKKKSNSKKNKKLTAVLPTTEVSDHTVLASAKLKGLSGPEYDNKLVELCINEDTAKSILTNEHLLEKTHDPLYFFELLGKKYASLVSSFFDISIFLALFYIENTKEAKAFEVFLLNHAKNIKVLHKFLLTVVIFKKENILSPLFNIILKKIISEDIFFNSTATNCFNDKNLSFNEKITYLVEIQGMLEKLHAPANLKLGLSSYIDDIELSQQFKQSHLLKDEAILTSVLLQRKILKFNSTKPLPIVDDIYWKDIYCAEFQLKYLKGKDILLPTDSKLAVTSYLDLYWRRRSCEIMYLSFIECFAVLLNRSTKIVALANLTNFDTTQKNFFYLYTQHCDYSAGVNLVQLHIINLELPMNKRLKTSFADKIIDNILNELIKLKYNSDICNALLKARKNLKTTISAEPIAENKAEKSPIIMNFT